MTAHPTPHQELTSPAGAAVTAMFLYEGFRDWVDVHERATLAIGRTPAATRTARQRATTDLDTVLVHTGGAIEQARMLAGYVPVVDAAVARVLGPHAQDPDQAGVLAYEVHNPVGWWIAGYAAHTGGSLPTHAEVGAYTRDQIRAFLTPNPPPGSTLRAVPATALATPTPAPTTTPTPGVRRSLR